MGGGDDPAVKALLGVAADRGKGTFLEDLQQLDLYRDGEVADLVEEDRAVRGAAGESAAVVVDGAGEGPLLVAEELRFNETLRVLGEVEADEVAGETLAEAPLARVIGDEAGAADGGGRRSLAGAGLAEEEGGEVLHAVPEEGFVAADVTGEDVVPEVQAQRLHDRGEASEGRFNEVEGATHLVKDRQVTQPLFAAETEGAETGEEFATEARRAGGVTAGDLLADEGVEGAAIAVVDGEEADAAQ